MLCITGMIKWVRETRAWFWWETLKERDHMKDLGTDGRIILECILKELGWRMWNGFIIFKTISSGELLWTRLWRFGFHKVRWESVSFSRGSPLRRLVRLSNQGGWRIQGTCGRWEKCVPSFGWKEWRKGPVEISRHIWQNYIKINVKGVGWESVGWIRVGLPENSDRWRVHVAG